MTHRFIAAALIPMGLIASLAFAQTQAPPTAGREPVSESPRQRAGAAPVLAQARPHADPDARACLDFVTNIGVIRCAEKYRGHSGSSQAAHR